MHMRARNAPLRNRRDASALSAADVDGDDDTMNQRTRRDTPECVSNYNSARQLLIGCSMPDAIEVKPQCEQNKDEEGTDKLYPPRSKLTLLFLIKNFSLARLAIVYNCQGSWIENSTTFIVAIHKKSSHGVCITYQLGEGAAAKMYVGDSCQRPYAIPTSDHHLLANLTVIGN